MNKLVLMFSTLLFTQISFAGLDLSRLGDTETKYCVVQLVATSLSQTVSQTCKADQGLTVVSSVEEELTVEQMQIQVLGTMRTKGYRMMSASHIGDSVAAQGISLTFEKL